MAFNILLVAYLLLAVAAMSADSTAWQRARLGQPTSYSNFSVYCGNIIPYGTSTSIISASCSGQGYDLAAPVDLYQSHIDLNQCLTNTDGKISAHADGNAMLTCTLGQQGIQACPGCSATIFDISCTDALGQLIASSIDLNEYIGVEWFGAEGDQGVPIISCTLPSDEDDHRGVYDGCTRLGATC